METKLVLYFGDSRDQLFPKDYLNYPPGQNLLALKPYADCAEGMGIFNLFFLHQVHGTVGSVIDVHTAVTMRSFSCEGDFLITNLPGVGIGIMTADCLPLLLHDPITQSIAAIHAGWRGAVAGIAPIALSRMMQEYGAQPDNIRAYLGPCIHSCCYQVGDQVVQALKDSSASASVLCSCQGKTLFDLPGFVAGQLEAAGLKKEAISLENSLCTHCNPRFWSYRRQGETAGRQMTVIALV
jgi:YfiH family protein